MCFSLELVHVWMGFESFGVWNIVPSCRFSNIFWWFEYQNTQCFSTLQFLCVVQVFFCPWFCVLWLYIMYFGLGFMFVRLITFWYKYDEPIMVFLCYFAWCMDSNRCRHQYCSAWQCSWFFLFNYMFYDTPIDLSNGIRDWKTFQFTSLQQMQMHHAFHSFQKKNSMGALKWD